MGQNKKKAVFTAEPAQLQQIEAVVRSGKYRSASEFLREAIDEKLMRLGRGRLVEQVALYCSEGHGDEDGELIDAQAFESEEP